MDGVDPVDGRKRREKRGGGQDLGRIGREREDAHCCATTNRGGEREDMERVDWVGRSGNKVRGMGEFV